jgi:NTP pyrophosphatase (non-canonical NTP hydrolase)
MDLKKLQKNVDEWVSQPQHKVKYFPPFEIQAQLSEEVGEIARELSHLHGFKKKKEGEETDGLKGEIGDLLFVLACLSNSHEIDLEEAFQASMDKKNKRDNERFTD